MKKLIFILLLIAGLTPSVFGQYTAAVRFGSGAPAYTPSSVKKESYLYYDQINQRFWTYNPSVSKWEMEALEYANGTPASSIDSRVKFIVDTSQATSRIFLRKNNVWTLLSTGGGGGAATVVTAPTILGDGSGGTPLRVDTGAYKIATKTDVTFAYDIYTGASYSGIPSVLAIGKKYLLVNGIDTTEATKVSATVFNANEVRGYVGSTPPTYIRDGVNYINLKNAHWKNANLSVIAGETVDFTYQNTAWKPLKGYVTPEDCGAKGDGVTDDLLAFRAMLKSNYPLSLPTGNYRISDTLGINRAGVDLTGYGVKITQTTADKGVFYVKQPNVVIRGFELIGLFSSVVVPANTYNAFAITSTNASNLKIENNIIHGFGVGGMWLPNAPHAIIKDNLIYGNCLTADVGDATDIHMWAGSEGAQILNNRCFSNNSQGIFNIAGGDELVISGNQCTPKDPITFINIDTALIKRRHGIVVNYNQSIVKNSEITNNIVSNTNWTGIYLTGADSVINVLISGNVLSRNGLVDGNSLSGGICVLSNPKNLLISNNTISEYKNRLNGTGGITFLPGSSGANATFADSASCTITGNNINYCTTGIAFGGLSTNIIASNNVIKNFTIKSIGITTIPGIAHVGGYTINNNNFETASSLGATGFISIDLQASTKKVLIINNTFRATGTTKDTGIVSNYHPKIIINNNRFYNLTTAVYSGGYISTSLNNSSYNNFVDCTTAYDISATAVGNGYYYYKNDVFENTTNTALSSIGSKAVFNKNLHIQEINSGTGIVCLESTTDLLINGYSTLSSFAITLKSSPIAGDVLKIYFGGYVASGGIQVTGATTFVGGTVYGDAIPNGVRSGDQIHVFYDPTLLAWRSKYLPYNNSILIGIGSAVLVAGTVTIANASITANSRITLNYTTKTSGVNVLIVASKTVGVGFTVEAIVPAGTTIAATDNNTFNYTISNQ